METIKIISQSNAVLIISTIEVLIHSLNYYFTDSKSAIYHLIIWSIWMILVLISRIIFNS